MINRRSIIKGLIAAPFIAALAPVVSAKNFIVEKAIEWSPWNVWRYGGIGFASRWRMLEKAEIDGKPGKFEMQFFADNESKIEGIWNIGIDENAVKKLNEKINKTSSW